jgi:flavodoxin
MTTIIVYDSVFGNTAEVARAIGAELELSQSVRLVSLQEAKPADLDGADLVIFGSPTRGFRPTPAIQEFVGSVSARLSGMRAAAFDTRLDPDSIHPAPLRWVVEVGGYAADVLQNKLSEHGAKRAAEPAGFLVGGTEGPLKDGEIARARDWARGIAAAGSGSKAA